MVVGIAEGPTDRVFHALADHTRRDIVRRCFAGEHSVSALARSYPMSFAAVQKHVAVLAAADLVTKRRRGRETLVRSNGERIAAAARLLDEYEQLWRDRLDRFGEVLAEATATPTPTDPPHPKGTR
jgi:DNA-binding transcriptional ArsR family regulator